MSVQGSRSSQRSQGTTTWACPKCGRRFVRQGQKHVCSTKTVEDHFKDSTEEIRHLYEGFIRLVKACGPFELNVNNRAIGFQGTKRIFAGVKPRPNTLDGYLDLPAGTTSPRLRSTSPYGKLVVGYFRISSLEQYDAEFERLVRLAYEVGKVNDELR
jgi:hypothetical protein